MRVLVVEAEIGQSIGEMIDLIAEGDEVVRCQPVGASVQPCVGLAGVAPCPLEHGIDLVVDVRDVDTTDYTERERGLLCARAAGIPTVTMPPP